MIAERLTLPPDLSAEQVACIATLRTMHIEIPSLMARLEYERLLPVPRRTAASLCMCAQPDYPETDRMEYHNMFAEPQTKRTNPECVLQYSTDLLASDDRDRIYALLSTTNCRTTVRAQQVLDGLDSQHFPALEIDYSRETSVVFQDITKYILNRDRSLLVICNHIPLAAEESDLGLPSWCPDWRQYSHASSSTIGYSIPPQRYDNVGRLEVKGFLVATAVHDGSHSFFPDWSYGWGDQRYAEAISRYWKLPSDVPLVQRLEFPRKVPMNTGSLNSFKTGDLLIMSSQRFSEAEDPIPLRERVAEFLILRKRDSEGFTYVGQGLEYMHNVFPVEEQALDHLLLSFTVY